ncbi:MAG: RES domain-containing protein [Aestuariivita sp.]|nr:RES domain-containing protein [Aestuariivita sp.]MCY4203378.1 RES domain-containing protein [Aestuariivita sp.]
MNAADLNALRRNSKQAKQIENLLSALQTVWPVMNFVRVTEATWATKNTIQIGTKSAPLSTSTGPCRFSPVNYGKTKRPKFKILYGVADLATAAYEAIICERSDLDQVRALTPSDHRTKCAVNVSTHAGQTLTLLDLTSGNAIRSGVPTDVIRYSNHTDGQHFSEFIYHQMPYIDRFLYSSRFTKNTCVGIC